uniref:Tetraspanin n=1 Tax=Ditylenchus dipsaci TaxID=166011 RepID=A0A915CTR2_9BILA
MGCCQKLSRGILIAMNLQMMVLGLLIVGGSIYIRSAFMDTSPNPYEMYELKQQVRIVVSNGYWGVIGLALRLQSNVQERGYRYISLAFQYNLQDALILRDRLACCGDGSQNNYNYQCQQMMQPNCRDVFTDHWNSWIGMGAVFIAGVYGMQLMSIIFSIVMACSSKYTTLNEAPSN